MNNIFVIALHNTRSRPDKDSSSFSSYQNLKMLSRLKRKIKK